MLAGGDSSAALSSLRPLTFGRAESRSPGRGVARAGYGASWGSLATGQVLATRHKLSSLAFSCLYILNTLQSNWNNENVPKTQVYFHCLVSCFRFSKLCQLQIVSRRCLGYSSFSENFFKTHSLPNLKSNCTQTFNTLRAKWYFVN